MRWRKVLAIAIGLLVVLPIAAVGIFLATFDPNAWKPRIQDAVIRATGRALALNGPISLQWSLVPTIEAHDVAFANIAGGSRPQMATARSIEAQIALLPLLANRIEIPQLTMIGPDILIETTSDGRGNWVFGKPAASSAPPDAAPAASSTAKKPMDIDVEAVKVENGTLQWRNGVTGRTVSVGLTSLDLQEPSATSPVAFDLVATYAGTRFAAKGETGSVARLRDAAAKTPWPVKLDISGDTATLTVDGQLATPPDFASFSGKASGKLADLTLLQPFVPDIILPPVQGLSFSLAVADSGPPLLRITDVTLQAGASDLSAYAPGLTLTELDVQAPRMDQPVSVQAAGSYADAPLTVAATLGAPSALIGGQPFPVDVSLAAAGATATAKGTLGDPAHVTGADLAVSARIPALAPFAALLHRPVPDARTIALDAHLAELPGGFVKGIALTQATLSLPQGDVSGDASAAFTQPVAITGNVTSKRIDLDALLELKSVDPPATAAASGQPVAASKAAPAPRGNANLLFSDAPLDLGVLRDADADVQVHIGELRTGGQTHRDIAGHFVLKAGKLTLDPISGTLPAGKMSGRLTIDANPAKPPVALVLRAPGLSLRAVELMLGLPSNASGALEVDANLNGAGDSLHAIAAGLNGTFGLALVNGVIDNAALNSLLGPVLTSASLPLSLINPGQIIGGTTALRCFAARLDARGGLATFRALYLDSARLKVSGSGTINLADETLALRLQPLARLADTGITVPLIIGGTIENPKARIDAANSAQANIMGLAQSAQNLAEVPLGVISGALGGPDRIGNGGDECASQLAIARGGPGGPQPNAPPSMLAAPANAAKKIINAPKNLLQDLFGK